MFELAIVAAGFTFLGPYGGLAGIGIALVIESIIPGGIIRGLPQWWYEKVFTPGYEWVAENISFTWMAEEAKKGVECVRKQYELYVPTLLKPWQEHEKQLVGQSLIPEMMTSIIGEFEAMKVALVGHVGYAGVLYNLRKLSEEIFTRLKTNLVGEAGENGILFNLKQGAVSVFEALKTALVSTGGKEQGLIPSLTGAIVGFFEDMYDALLDKPDGWLQKFYKETKKLLEGLIAKVRELIKDLKELIGLQDNVHDGGNGGGAQFGLRVGKTARYLLHRGEFVINPAYPRRDLLEGLFRAIGGSLDRWMPDIQAALGALPALTIAPQVALPGGGAGDTHITNIYHIHRFQVSADSKSTAKSILAQLDQLRGPGG